MLLKKTDIRQLVITALPGWFSVDPRKKKIFSLSGLNLTNWENQEEMIILHGIDMHGELPKKQIGVEVINVNHDQRKFSVLLQKGVISIRSLKLLLRIISPAAAKEKYDNCILDRIEEITPKGEANEGDIYIYTNDNFFLFDTIVKVIKHFWQHVMAVLKSFNPSQATEKLLVFWAVFLGVKTKKNQTNKEALNAFISSINTKKGTLISLYKLLDDFFNPGKHQEKYKLVKASEDTFVWSPRQICVLNLYTSYLDAKQIKILNKLLEESLPLGTFIQHYITENSDGYASSYGVENGMT